LGFGVWDLVFPLHSMALAWDCVHPTQTGHTIIARAFLGAVGFKW